MSDHEIGALAKTISPPVERRIDRDLLDNVMDALTSGRFDHLALFDFWTSIDAQVGQAPSQELRQELADLRARFVAGMVDAECGRIERAFRLSTDAGYQSWVSTLALAVTEFRIGFASRLCEYGFPFSESDRPAVKRLQTAVASMLQRRWGEVHDEIEYLAELPFIPALTRARLLVMLAEIQLFRFRKTRTANERLSEAAALAPDDGRVLGNWGAYWRELGRLDEAMSACRRAIDTAPKIADGYTELASCFEQRGDMGSAEEWLKKAITTAAGDAAGCSRLLSLYGKPSLFDAHRAELQPLAERAIAISPEGAWQVYLNLGKAYSDNQQLDEADRCYQKSVALAPTTPSVYVAVGELREKQERLDDALAAYQKAISVAPECDDGHCELGLFYERQNKWPEALRAYQAAPLRNPEWAEFGRARIAEAHARLGKYQDAEELLKAELRSHPANEHAIGALQQIAIDYYRKQFNTDAAARLYDAMLAILGESYRGGYHNQLGNLNDWAGDSGQAIIEYLRAIEVSPDKAVFRRNLARSYRTLKQYPQAAAELSNALQIDNDNEAYQRETALLLNAQGNDCYSRGSYREAVDYYMRALEAAPKDDVIYSNLGRAWEEVRERGATRFALGKAAEAFRQARAIQKLDEYERDIERVERKRVFGERYGEQAIDRLHVVTPIAVEVAIDLIPYTMGGPENALSDELSSRFAEMRARVQRQFGVAIPGVRVRENEADLPHGVYIIMITEIPLVSGTIRKDRRFFPGSAQQLASLGITGEEAINPLSGHEGFWIQQADWSRVEAASLELWSVIEYLVNHLEGVVQRNLSEFVGHQEVVSLLEKEALEKSPEKLSALTSVCRALVAERVPLKSFGEIVRVFESLTSQGTSPEHIVEHIRSLPVLRPHLPGNDAEHAFLPLGPRFETAIRNAIHRTGPNAVLAMEPERCQEALTAVRNAVAEHQGATLLVADSDLRSFVRLLIELEFPDVPVVSRPEMLPELDGQGRAPVDLEEESRRSGPRASGPALLEPEGEGSGVPESVPECDPTSITVWVNHKFTETQARADERPMKDTFSLMLDGLFYELGVVLPQVQVVVDNTLGRDEFRFALNGREFGPLPGLKPDEFLVNETLDALAPLKIKGREGINPANGIECAIVRDEADVLEACRKAGLTVWGPTGFLVLALAAEIRRNARDFHNHRVTTYILESLAAAFPDLIDAARRRFSITTLCGVLQDLLEEEISIRDLRAILESMLSIGGTTDAELSRYIVFNPRAPGLCWVSRPKEVEDLSILEYSSFVRASLKRHISHKYTRGGNTLVVYLLDPEIERRLRHASAQPLTIQEEEKLMSAVGQEVGRMPSTTQFPVILTGMEIRKTTRRLLAAQFPRLAVLSYQELSPDMNIQPIARISWR